jgi:hypothetical protein
MTTGLLFDLLNPEPVRHRYVPDTSKAAHVAAVNSGRLSKRCQDVLAWLLACPGTPTAAELARHVTGVARPSLEACLHIRRGFCDLKRAGMVVKGQDRRCSVTGIVANTWKSVNR